MGGGLRVVQKDARLRKARAADVDGKADQPGQRRATRRCAKDIHRLIGQPPTESFRGASESLVRPNAVLVLHQYKNRIGPFQMMLSATTQFLNQQE
jgi:hypothetical protein